MTKDPRTGELKHRGSVSRSENSTQTQQQQVKLTKTKTKSTAAKAKTRQPEKKSQEFDSTMPSTETQTDKEHQSRDEELHRKLDSLADRFDKVEKVSGDYKTSIEDLKEENAILKEHMNELVLEIQRNTYAIQQLSSKQGNLEVTMRKKNLVFDGVPEAPGGRENLHDTIYSLLMEMGIAQPLDYDVVYRIGQKKDKFTRPILISFIKQDDRNLVYANRSQLSKSQHYRKVWVSEDVTPQVRRVRNVIREVAKEARSKGARCTATPVSVTINDRKFTEANLEDLPPEFAVEKIKMKKIGETIAYSSEHAPFSNLYPAAVPIGKHVYTSSEQGFRHIRAKENKQHNIAARILWSRDTYDMMDLDRDMPVSKEWKEKEDFILFKCMFRKSLYLALET